MVAAQLFASAAGVVLALGRARTDLEEHELASEHERIARDLHDTVIQRLFAIGMGLQSVQRLASPTVGERIETAVDAIDTVIRDIRETIFDLNRAPNVEDDLRQRVAEITKETVDQLGFVPTVSYRGPVETVLDETRLTQLLAVLREALSNAARHSGARSVHVSIAVDEAFIVLEVADDGVGMPESGAEAEAELAAARRAGGHGLGNMAERARQLGGRLLIRPGEDRGTSVEWRIPA
jgi:signal transduction histidine kinase